MKHTRQEGAGQTRVRLATPAEIAEFCGVPVGTVYQWSSRGGGPKLIKVGRHLRARWSDVEAWLDAQTIQSEEREATA